MRLSLINMRRTPIKNSRPQRADIQRAADGYCFRLRNIFLYPLIHILSESKRICIGAQGNIAAGGIKQILPVWKMVFEGQDAKTSYP